MSSSTLALQKAIKAAGYDPGPLDGLWGKKTLRGVMAVAACKQPDDLMTQIADNLVTPMIGADITTPLRIAHFIGQVCVETAYFTKLVEAGTRSYFDKYEPGTATGKVLGNTEMGDGYLFRGRGDIMITGRWNYDHFGKLIGLNLIDHPDWAAQPDVAARLAVAYWNDRGCSAWADVNNATRVTKAVQGSNGALPERTACTARVLALFNSN